MGTDKNIKLHIVTDIKNKIQRESRTMGEHKVFVGSLSFDANEDDLYSLFEKYGSVKDATVITDRDTGKSRGFGFVEFHSKEDCQAAVVGAHGKEIQGRAINCNIARPRGESGGGRGGGGGGGRGGGYGGG